MSNQLEAIVPKILARGMLSFREHAFMPRLVNADFSAEAAQKGDAISVMIPGEVTVEDVVPNQTPPDAPDTTAQTKTLKLDRWKKVAFHLSDKDMMQIDADRHFIPFQMQEAITALAAEVNKSFFEQIIYAQNTLYDKDGKFFSTDPNQHSHNFSGVKPILALRKMLNEHKAPKSGRFGILGFDEEAELLNLPQFSDVEKSGETAVKREGEIGRKYGFDWFSSDQLHRHTASTTDTFNPSSTHHAQAQQMTIRNINTKPIPGDIIISNANDGIATVLNVERTISSQSYVLNLATPIIVGVSSSAVLKMAQPTTNNLVCHRDAFAFAMRPLASATEQMGLGNRILSVTDPETGLSLRLEISRQYKRTLWEFDVLWGVEMVRPEWAIRMIF